MRFYLCGLLMENPWFTHSPQPEPQEFNIAVKESTFHSTVPQQLLTIILRN